MITSAVIFGIVIGFVLFTRGWYSMAAAAMIFLGAAIDLMPENPDATVPYLALMLIALASARDLYRKAKIERVRE